MLRVIIYKAEQRSKSIKTLCYKAPSPNGTVDRFPLVFRQIQTMMVIRIYPMEINGQAKEEKIQPVKANGDPKFNVLAKECRSERQHGYKKEKK